MSAALPRALKQRGIDVRILMPAYQGVFDKISSLSVVASLPGHAAIEPCLIGESQTHDGIPVYLVLAPSLYQRQGTPYTTPEGYDWGDNDLRFARLCLAATEIARGIEGLDWKPDLVHVNDWTSALTPGYMQWTGLEMPSILTIHNLAHQGVFPADRLDALGIPHDAYRTDGVEFHGYISFMKAGLIYADRVTTVSATYADEITSDHLGSGLHGVTRGLAAEGRLSGIVNGLEEGWDPSSDKHLPFPFSAENLKGKRANTDFIRTSLCLSASDGPLFGVVSRLVHQKGLDLVAEIAGHIVEQGGQIAILGTGDPGVERMLLDLTRRHRGSIGLIAGFSDTMAHRLVAASDFFLMPSRFEPCGLTQMQAQRYGALPVAHATGGLADTIEDGETGFLFKDFSYDNFLGACNRAFETFADKGRLDAMRRTAMRKVFDWDEPAAAYERLYEEVTGIAVVRPVSLPLARKTLAAPAREARASAA
ncbi:starch synthase [Kaistia dalseonensis]|uniref:Glycogen synthase n=1 Tax=Kaistia dalseonensis TaxID=410840 RepID=A0ABU0H9M2_9HYPH|nr:starch synthase [Kaistia dalseonensis]